MVSRNFILNLKKTLKQKHLVVALDVGEIIFMVNQKLPKSERFYMSDWEKLTKRYKMSPDTLSDIELELLQVFADSYIKYKLEYYKKMEQGDAGSFKKYKELYEMINGRAKPINIIVEKEEKQAEIEGKTALNILADLLKNTASSLPDRLSHKKDVVDAEFEVEDE